MEKDNDKSFTLLFLSMLITISFLAAAIIVYIKGSDLYKIEKNITEIETVIDEDGNVLGILKDSNGDIVYVDLRYEK